MNLRLRFLKPKRNNLFKKRNPPSIWTPLKVTILSTAAYDVSLCGFHFYYIILSIGLAKYMTDIFPSTALSRIFSIRIRNYLLFLELTNNTELLCDITQYLKVRDLISFLSASTHTYSFRKVTAIQIRLLKAKVQYYQKPKIQPTLQLFVNLLPTKALSPSATIKGQKLIKDFECLKKFNQGIHIAKRIKKIGNQPSNSSDKKSELNISREIDKKNIQLKKNNYPRQIKVQSPHGFQNTQKTQKKIEQPQKNRIISQRMPVSLDYIRFQELQYQLARIDYQQRKKKRLKQSRQRISFTTVQQLRQMAVSDPCSRLILDKMERDQMTKIENTYAQLWQMKSARQNQARIRKTIFVQQQQSQNIVVAKESIVHKLLANIKSFIRKQ